MTTLGTVAAVRRVTQGDELAVDASAGDWTLVVDDVTAFDESGGALRIGGDDAAAQIVAYASVDDDESTITLLAPLVQGWAAGTRVDDWDAATSAPVIELRAHVATLNDVDNDEPLDAAVAYSIVPLLPEGIRDSAGESVVLEQQGGEWVVVNVRGQLPQIDGSMLAPSTIDESALSFTVDGMSATVGDVEPSAPAVGDLWFDASSGYVMRQWDGSTWQPYQLGAGALASGSVSLSKVTFTARDLGGVSTSIGAAAPSSALAGDLWYDSANGYRLNRYSGSAWQPMQWGTAAIAAGSIGSAQLSVTARDLGGVTTTIGAQPSSPLAGDLWYDSANGYRLNRYSGSAWVAVQFGTSAIAAGSITAALVAANTITAAQLAAGTITANEIAARTITTDRVAAGAITANEIAALTITAAQIAAGTITASQIAAGTITSDRIAAGSIQSDRIAAGTIQGDRIAATTITSELLAADAVVAGKIAAGSITADEIAAGSITADLLAANAVVAGKIAAGALDAQSITAGSIIAGNFSGTISGSATTPTSILNALLTGSTVSIDADSGAILIYATPGTATVAQFSTAGAASWTCPAGATTAKVEAWGAGGGGASGSSAAGGGGEYAANNAVPVTPGQLYNLVVGAAGAGGAGSGIVTSAPRSGTAGGDSYFTASTEVRAHGGQGGSSTGTGGAGGTGSTAPVHFKGGNGGSSGYVAPNAGAGGGSSAGTNAAGNNGADGGIAPGVGGTAPSGGAKGGDGASPVGGGTAGAAGSAPGAGGGGGTHPLNTPTAVTAGGAGAVGRIKITTVVGSGVLIGSISAVAGTDQYGNVYSAGIVLPLDSIASSDLNGATLPGRYFASPTSSNCPTTTSYYAVDVVARSDRTWLAQIAYRIGTSDSPEIWLRQYSTTSGWRSWHRVYDDTGTLTTGIVTATAPHTINSQTLRRVGATVQFQVTFTLGAAITVPANGDIGNTTVGNVDAAYRPPFAAALVSAGTGQTVHGALSSAGDVQLTNVPPGSTLASGTQLQLVGTYLSP